MEEYKHQTINFSGQTAIVTGSSSGIGAGIAKGLAAVGANVLVNYAGNPAGAEQVVQEITQYGAGKAFAFKADVSQEADVQAMFKAATEKWGTVDILVSNAGVQKDSPFLDMTLDKWNGLMGINLAGAFLCSREAAREFTRRGPVPYSKTLGKIIFISSVHQVIPWSGHANYASSKGGINLLMKSVAQELGPRKIRVNSICPGAIKTAINRAAWQTPEAEAKLLELIPYKRVGESCDIAKVAVWLASDESDYIHGADIFVDGGMTLYPRFSQGG
jgi:glucose 1-dehydrogenase